ncbi:MAG TPA: acyl-CoA dehydrogenase family protein [Burkholderiales bacterium]|nr:acyl-CoA dehydrogenase family protein [Burkholderiales bacterium]
MSDLESFRRDTRAWLEANCPQEMRQPITSENDACWGGRRFKFQSEAQRRWMQVMGERGWTVPAWPKVYGGGGLSREEAAVLAAEMRELGCRPPLVSFGIWMLGPALLAHGNEEQKLEHLPKIARGEIRWCQGYSEPNAGSDLASLATKAEVHDDHLIINGQKIWTSYADEADWIFCLVRTSTAKKHTGISFVLFDMESPGVSTRPIVLISGKSPFCETFFDNVKVPRRNVVGELNAGWTIAKYLLTHEREMIGGIGDRGAVKPLGEFAADAVGLDERGRLRETTLRAQIARFETDEAAFRLLMQATMDRARHGMGNPAMSSALKYYGAELNKRRWELMVSAAGSDGLEWEGERSHDGTVARTWLRTKGNSIEGGTSEIQLNVVAKRILGLPGV